MNFFKLISFSIILLSSTLSEACSDRSYDYKLPDEIGNDFKIFHEKTTHFVWDGNVPLYEWTSSVEETISIVNDKGEKEIVIPENRTTWIFEDGTFIPMAKIQGGNSYSIITDHLGTPTEAYNDQGRKVWSRGLNIYGETRKETGLKNFIPYLYQGQYLDVETELAYNRYRYYSPGSGTYISRDPIGIIGGMNLHSYVKDTNSWVDIFGLSDIFIFGNSNARPSRDGRQW